MEGYRETTWSFLMKPPSLCKWSFRKHNTLKMSFGIKPSLSVLFLASCWDLKKSDLAERENGKELQEKMILLKCHLHMLLLKFHVTLKQVGQRTMKK